MIRAGDINCIYIELTKKAYNGEGSKFYIRVLGMSMRNSFQFCLIGTFAPRIARALLHAGAIYYITRKWPTGCHSPSIRGKHHIHMSVIWSRAPSTIVQLR